MAFTFGDVRKNLKKKGFVEDKSGDHIYLNHYHQGKATGSYTKVSHGANKDDVGPDLIRRMKDQLKLSTNSQVNDLAKCPMSEASYVAILKSAKVIP
jgi:predicted RNA binding protein YcfA (HicA-like mRNA interferase family)